LNFGSSLGEFGAVDYPVLVIAKLKVDGLKTGVRKDGPDCANNPILFGTILDIVHVDRCRLRYYPRRSRLSKHRRPCRSDNGVALKGVDSSYRVNDRIKLLSVLLSGPAVKRSANDTQNNKPNLIGDGERDAHGNEDCDDND
jgi:hypothetical protein